MLGLRSQRETIAVLEETLGQISDAVVICSANTHDRACILRRREHDIQDDSVRTCVLRRLDRLGYLCDDITGVYAASVNTPSSGTEAAKLKLAWEALLCHEQPQARVQATFLEEIAFHLRGQHSALRATEGTDADISSASDYSDSDTESTTTLTSGASASGASASGDENDA